MSRIYRCGRVLCLALALTAVILSLCACRTSLPQGEAVVSLQVEMPALSHESGRYDSGFTLTAAVPRGTVVRYTLDGSEPAAGSEQFPEDGLFIDDRTDQPNVLAAVDSKLFTAEEEFSPGNVHKGTVVRAAAFTDEGTRSPTVTAAYFVGTEHSGIKLVSLALDSSSLFDYDSGIYVFGAAYDRWMASDSDAHKAESWELQGNFSQKGREWERPVNVQIFEKDGTLGIEQDMGIRVMGAASRTYYQKSFRLTAREEYGKKHLEYDLISGLTTDSTGEPLQKYKSFVLRNGGNDCGYSLLRDPFIQSLVSDRDIATQSAEPALVYINGEFWGLYSITEDYSDNYIQYNYGIDKDNAVIIKNGQVEEGDEEDIELFDLINGAIYSGKAADDEYYRALCEMIDIQSLADYMAVQIYINNEDGPFEGNNWRIWRARENSAALGNEYGDGRWRFMLYDTDMSLGLYSDGGDYTDNTLGRLLDYDWGWALLLEKLLGNSDFRELFVTTFCDLHNTAFAPENYLPVLEKLESRYAPFAADQYLRNGPAWVVKWDDVNTRFASEVDKIRRFMEGRYSYSMEMLAQELELGEPITFSLEVVSPEGGRVTVNTVTPQLAEGCWHGQYFSGFALTVTAHPAPGYVFAGWQGAQDGSESSVTLVPDGDTALTAVFEFVG